MQSSDSAWNTTRLPARILADIGAAGCAGALVAPVITIIDRSIIENASGRNTLLGSIKSSARTLFTRPHRFFFSVPFGLIFMLYTGTYTTANALDTAASTISRASPSAVTHGLPKFLATSAANLSLCLYKDARFARLFGSHTAARPVPGRSFLLFAARDCMTIFASFNVPPLLAPHLAAPASHLKVSPESAAQFLAPAAVQMFSTPLHLLGLDLYNRPKDVSVSERWVRVRRDWAKSTLARMCRIVPAFGVGGVVNARMRRELMGRIEEESKL